MMTMCVANIESCGCINDDRSRHDCKVTQYEQRGGGVVSYLVMQCNKLLAMIMSKGNYPPFIQPSPLGLP